MNSRPFCRSVGDAACKIPNQARIGAADLFLFFLIQARCEIIDLDVSVLPFITDTEDLPRELFFECFFSTFRLKLLGTAPGGASIWTKILPPVDARVRGGRCRKIC